MSKLLFKQLPVFDGTSCSVTSVSIDGNCIEAVGDIVDDGSYDEVITGPFLLMPGMVNLHTHLPMTLFRGMAEDVPLEQWLHNTIFPLEKQFISEEAVYLGSLWAMAESLMNGVTTAADMYFFEEQIGKAARQIGMKVMLGEGLLSFPTPSASTPREGLNKTKILLERYKNDSLISVAVAPHSLYLVDEPWLCAAAELSSEYDIPFHIHMAETQQEADTFFQKYGKREFMQCAEWGILSPRVIAAHSIWIDAEERTVMAQHGVTVAHCPSSNTKLSSGIAPITELLQDGVAVAVATDGAASNNNLSLIQEAELAAKLQKVRHNPTVLPAEQVLKMITSIPGRMFSDKRGRIIQGAPADLVLLNTDSPELYPAECHAATLLYSASGRDMERVFVNGREVWSKRQGFSSIDLPYLQKQTAPLRREIASFLHTLREQQ